MTPEQKQQRIEQIERWLMLHTSANSDPYVDRARAFDELRFLLSLVSQEAETLHYFKADSEGRCVTCGKLRLWQYHVDEEIDAATLMRSACVERVKAMGHGLTVEIGSGQLIPDPDGPWFLKSDIITALESVSIQGQK